MSEEFKITLSFKLDPNDKDLVAMDLDTHDTEIETGKLERAVRDPDTSRMPSHELAFYQWFYQISHMAGRHEREYHAKNDTEEPDQAG